MCTRRGRCTGADGVAPGGSQAGIGIAWVIPAGQIDGFRWFRLREYLSSP